MHFRIGLRLVAVALVATACGTSTTTHAGMNMTTPTPSASAGMSMATPSTSARAGMSVDIVMKDIAFTPTTLSVKQGDTVKFRFANTGAVLHEAVIGNVDVQAQAEMAMQHGGHQGMNMANVIEVKPGATGELTVTFDKAGDVVIGCHQPGHYAGGMRATVTVGA